MLRFRRFSRQSYWKVLKSTDEDLRDNIIITDKDCEGGGCRWEFRLTEHNLRNDRTGVQIRMFDDAVISLKNQKIVDTLIHLEKCNTLDNVEKILRRNGFEEVID